MRKASPCTVISAIMRVMDVISTPYQANERVMRSHINAEDRVNTAAGFGLEGSGVSHAGRSDHRLDYTTD